MLLTVVTCPDVRVEEELSEVELSPEWPFGSWYEGRAMELSPIVKEVVVVSESSSCETVCVAITYNYYSHYRMNLCFTLELILINADLFSNDCLCMKEDQICNWNTRLTSSCIGVSFCGEFGCCCRFTFWVKRHYFRGTIASIPDATIFGNPL